MQRVTIADLGTDRTNRVWVTHGDQSVVQVNDAQVFRGKLVGFVDGKYLELTPDTLHAIEVRKLSVGRTLGLAAATLGAAAAIAAMVSGSEDHFDECVGDDECEDGGM
jgi:hypothetical protein